MVDDSQFEGPRALNQGDLAKVGNFDTMEVVREQAQVTFEVFDTLHNEIDDGWNNFSDEDEPATINGQALGDGKNVDDGSNNAFDPTILEDVVAKLYKGSKSSKLVTTILLMKLCIFHGMTKRFADELFTLLHWHLLPTDICLLANYHVAKSLIGKLSLDYQNIHACLVGCVFFRKDLTDELQCLNVEVLGTKMRIIRYHL